MRARSILNLQGILQYLYRSSRSQMFFEICVLKSGSEELKKCPPASTAVLQLVNVFERKPRQKKNQYTNVQPINKGSRLDQPTNEKQLFSFTLQNILSLRSGSVLRNYWLKDLGTGEGLNYCFRRNYHWLHFIMMVILKGLT